MNQSITVAVFLGAVESIAMILSYRTEIPWPHVDVGHKIVPNPPVIPQSVPVHNPIRAAIGFDPVCSSTKDMTRVTYYDTNPIDS